METHGGVVAGKTEGRKEGGDGGDGYDVKSIRVREHARSRQQAAGGWGGKDARSIQTLVPDKGRGL